MNSEFSSRKPVIGMQRRVRRERYWNDVLCVWMENPELVASSREVRKRWRLRRMLLGTVRFRGRK